MKQTAVQWLYDEIKHIIPNDFLKTFDQAKAMELEQRKEDFRKGWQGNKSKEWNCEFYLIKHINNDFKSE